MSIILFERGLTMSEIINFNAVLEKSISLPGVKINRDEFLRSALSTHFDEETVNNAVLYNPAQAGISADEIKKIANSSIRLETNKVSAFSFAAGIPGGLAIAATVPADIIQYLGHILRIMQKLIYLYGWQDIFDENGNMDDETTNLLTLFAGVMFGVSGAAAAIKKIADAAAQNVAKKLAKKALMKGAIYPIVKKIAVALGAHMTKDVFAKGVSKIIPIIGGLASGGITYATYRPMAIRLRNHLSTLKLADAEYYQTVSSDENSDIIEGEFTE